MKALHKGGIKVLEFTNRGDFAWEVFNELEKYCREYLPDMILGAGSISDETMANMYISSGSNFIVGPLTPSPTLLVKKFEAISKVKEDFLITKMHKITIKKLRVSSIN